MSALAKLVALSLAVSKGSAPRLSKKELGKSGKNFYKEMNKQVANSKKSNKNEEIRRAINALKRLNKTKRSKSSRR